MCRDYNVELLPVHCHWISASANTLDTASPAVVAEPDGQIATIYRTIVRRTAVRFQMARDYSDVFTQIVIMEDD
ncbi:MAG: hypothetical protein P0107_01120 [Nitrosomonas sp.]|nr:hypothetical protein [Nitrosomonas sp.]